VASAAMPIRNGWISNCTACHISPWCPGLCLRDEKSNYNVVM